jgi:hypothetical protein
MKGVAHGILFERPVNVS